MQNKGVCLSFVNSADVAVAVAKLLHKRKSSIINYG